MGPRNLIILLVVVLAACHVRRDPAPLVIRGGTIYTMDATNPVVEAVAIRGDTIVFAGSQTDLRRYIGKDTRIIELEGKTMTPGFIESHGHLMETGYKELNLDLSGVTTYDQMVRKVQEAVDRAAPGQWIVGRGWHQDKWKETFPQVKGLPVHDGISEVAPDNPVFLEHASGHAGLANDKAMVLAGIYALTPANTAGLLDGKGEVLRDNDGHPTGMFIERGMELITKFIPAGTRERDEQALELALAACLRNGITSFHDAGASQQNIDLYQSFLSAGKLSVRLYVMINGGNRDMFYRWMKRGPRIDPDHLLTVRAVKLTADGALGSRGAWLLEPYSDRAGHFGHETLPMDTVYQTARIAAEHGFQLCTHAIGDRANHEVLNQYEKAFRETNTPSEELRFRIEHAQHLDAADIPRFGKLGVIASMQSIHMSSDRPWAIDRLGPERIAEGAYVWQKLLQSGARIVNGTDTPVEPINPIACFYAAVTRKTLEGEPEGGYEPDQKMTREQALRSYTLDAAYAAFEEDVKGSIEPGKLADFTVFSRDIMTVPEDSILNTHVEMTIVGGNVVYEAH
ncbi:MAG: amidohydrolase [Cyclobacteriaceae bacterium]|jgi:predicted amidohydrolase YtcJ|nr:amidohydrolase [Cyclobacteriaceae bacterium]